jgi:hypothetical protein
MYHRMSIGYGMMAAENGAMAHHVCLLSLCSFHDRNDPRSIMNRSDITIFRHTGAVSQQFKSLSRRWNSFRPDDWISRTI